MKNILELELNLLDREILGSSFIVIGYLNFIRAGEEERLKLLHYPTSINPAHLLFIGQQFIFLGIGVLLSVAYNRYLLAIEENEIEAIAPLETLYKAYLVSFFSNYYRVLSLGLLLNFFNKDEEII